MASAATVVERSSCVATPIGLSGGARRAQLALGACEAAPNLAIVSFADTAPQAVGLTTAAQLLREKGRPAARRLLDPDSPATTPPTPAHRARGSSPAATAIAT